MGTIDSTIHKIIGGPNLPPVEKPTPTPANTGDWVSNGQKYGTPVKSTSEQIYGYPGTPSKATPIGPSASINNLVNTNSNQVDMVARSVSEPNLSWSPAQVRFPEIYFSLMYIDRCTFPRLKTSFSGNPFWYKCLFFICLSRIGSAKVCSEFRNIVSLSKETAQTPRINRWLLWSFWKPNSIKGSWVNQA